MDYIFSCTHQSLTHNICDDTSQQLHLTQDILFHSTHSLPMTTHTQEVYPLHNFQFITLSLYSTFVFLGFIFSDLTLVLLSILYSLFSVATLPVFQSSKLFLTSVRLFYLTAFLVLFIVLSSLSAWLVTPVSHVFCFTSLLLHSLLHSFLHS